MGVSFKVSKVGKRFRPNPKPSSSPALPTSSPHNSGQNPNETAHSLQKNPPNPPTIVAQEEAAVLGSSVLSANGGKHLPSDQEISFVLKLLPDGFSIEKPNEMDKLQGSLENVPKSLHPYNRMSQTLFSAIEAGQLPADILDDIPSKYYNGTIVCEIHDYRSCMPEGTYGAAAEQVPIINKVLLRMSLENIVKDIPTISDDSWSYSDLMEMESRALKAIQPQLLLDPTPMLDRLCSNTNQNKLNLVVSNCKRKRLPQKDFVNAAHKQMLGKTICVGKVPGNTYHDSGDIRSISGDLAGQQAHRSLTMQHVSSGLQSPRPMQEGSLPALPRTSQPLFQTRINQDQFPTSPNNFPMISAQIPLSQNIMNAYPDKMNQDRQQATMTTVNRQKQIPVGQEIDQHSFGIHRLEGAFGADMQWKNAQFQQQMDAKGIQYPTSIPGQKYPSLISDITNSDAGNSFYLSQQGKKICVKQEQTEIEKIERQEPDKFTNVLQMTETEIRSIDHQRLRPQQLTQQPFIRPQFPIQQQWQNMSSPMEDIRKDDMLSKRRVQQSSRVPGATSIQSPTSVKSGEHSTGSLIGQFGVIGAFLSQKEKASTISGSVTSSPSDSVQKQTQKRKASSMTKSHGISGVASPASVGNISTPINASSPSVLSASLTDSTMLDRFSKIDMLTQRYQLNSKKNKVESFHFSKPSMHSKEEIGRCLSDVKIAEDFKHPVKPMSKSVIGGTRNNPKSRLMTCMHPNLLQGRNRYRLIMNEKLPDGNVILQYGDMEESDNHFQDCMLILPNTHNADLLAAQHRLLMERDGYQVIDDQIVARTNAGNGHPSSTSGMPVDNHVPEVQQSDVVPGQQSGVVLTNGNNDINHLSSKNIPNNTRVLPSGNTHVLPISQGYLPNGPTATMSTRPQQMEQALLQQQHNQQHQMQQQQMQQQQMQQQPMQSQLQLQNHQNQMQPPQQQQLQHAQIQRSSSLLQMTPLSQFMGQSTNVQLGASPMLNKTQLQLQALQQAQQQQLPRKGMLGLGSMGMGNSMMGIGALNNAMGGARCISSPLSQMQGLNNIGTTQMNLNPATNFSVGLRPGLTTQQLAKLRMQQSRMLAAQSGITSLPSNGNQMLSSTMGMSMLGRSNISSLQRNPIASMGPPKLPGTNSYMNQQQQLQLQHQQLQLQQQQQQQLQHLQQQQLQQQPPPQQQQQISSPLHHSQVSSPSMISSPPAVAMQQQLNQQISPQQLNQQIAMSPQQLSGGTLQQLNQQIAMSPQQLSGGTLPQMNNGNTAGQGPASPQLSSQTHNSVGSISSSPMELQGTTNKPSSVNNV